MTNAEDDLLVSLLNTRLTDTDAVILRYERRKSESSEFLVPEEKFFGETMR